MIRNDQIQAAWIAKLKANSNIAARVTANEIREEKWKGTGFSYPNIRVKLGSLTPTIPNNTCQIFRSEVSIRVYEEQKSSKTADEIAGIVATEFWLHPFTSNGIKFTAINLVSVMPADVPEWDMDSWMAEVNLTCLVQSA
jgi:hypothetical protein